MRKPPDKKKPPDNNNTNNNKSGDNNNNNNNKARNNRNRRRRNGKKSVPNNKAVTAAEDSKNTSDVSGTPETESTNGNNIQNNNNNNNNNKNGRKQRQRQGQRQRGNQVNENDNDNNANNNNNTTTNNNNKQPSKQRKPKKKRKKYPWRKHIPEGTVDPITLDNLVSLEYPPFALCADEPYVPVSVWPVPLEQSNSNNNSNDKKTNEATASDENLEDLHRQRLADQWGEYLLPDKKENTTNKDKDKPNPTPLSKKPLNLFDGRALAFYMVSQLQFIDPFTRRDLTRAELQNLDLYLDKHGNKSSKKLKVTDAYDAKGITLSSAGAAASTAQGRTDIMQQMAQQLLNSLFVGQPSVSEQPVSLQEQYAATQRREQRQQQQRLAEQQAGGGFLQASSSSEQHGFMIIDDDENPELRGRNEFPSLAAAAAAAAVPPTMYSSSHIAEQYRNRRPVTTNEVAAFPALPKTEQASSTEATTTAAASASAPTKPKKSKTLSKISGIVKKTTAHEKQKQWEAREAARRKAMLSNLTYGMNPVAMDPSQSVPAPLTATAASAASEELLQRNKAFADALGVKPASTRHYASGWARPTEINELEVALYPDALIVSAKEHTMDVLVKLERRWKRFLDDDKVASLPLNKMNRGLRKLVHHYAEFWHLKTESFDPEPNRYIHCVKLPETRMPQPLLSEVARNWRGPSLPDATRTIASVMHDHTSQQTAGQTTAPPVLRSATAMSSSKGDLVAFAAQMNSRSEVLMDKQRPQLKLLPRSVPLELPPPAEDAQANLEEDLRRKQVRLEEKQRKEREIEQKKKQALEDAFCSDDDESVQEKAAGFSDSDSEWGDDQEAVFDGSDEE